MTPAWHLQIGPTFEAPTAAEAARRVLEFGMARSGAERGTIVLGPSDFLPGLRVQVRRDGSETMTWDGGVDRYSRTIAERVLQTGQPTVYRTLDDHSIEVAASILDLSLRVILCIPIPVGDRVLGVLYLDSSGLGTDEFDATLPDLTQLGRVLGYRLERDAGLAKAQETQDTIAFVAHELRAPLTAIVGYAGLVDPRDDQEESVKDLVGVALEQGTRMSALIDDAVQLWRARSDATIGFTSIPPSELVRRTLQVVRPLAGPKEVAVESRVDAELRAVRADPHRIQQVFLNLAGNAVRYAPTGTQVLIRARPEPAGSLVAELDMVRFSISDEGPGIPVDEQPRIFEKFVRGRSAQGSGTGLGLSIARAIVQAHGGRIWVDSAPGKGCTFSFTLPATP